MDREFASFSFHNKTIVLLVWTCQSVKFAEQVWCPLLGRGDLSQPIDESHEAFVATDHRNQDLTPLGRKSTRSLYNKPLVDLGTKQQASGQEDTVLVFVALNWAQRLLQAQKLITKQPTWNEEARSSDVENPKARKVRTKRKQSV